MGRINHPDLFLLAVCRSDPTLLHLAESEMLVEISIFGRETNAFFALTGRYQEEVVGFAHALTLGQERFTIRCDRKERIIVATLGETLHFSLQIGGIDHGCGMPYTRKIQGFGIVSPSKSIDTRLERLGHIGFFARSQLVNTKSFAITLITVALHALPGHITAIGRESRVGVIS